MVHTAAARPPAQLHPRQTDAQLAGLGKHVTANES